MFVLLTYNKAGMFARPEFKACWNCWLLRQKYHKNYHFALS